MYVSGDAESKAAYEERYTEFYNYVSDNHIVIFSEPSYYSVPDSVDFTINPMTQFYEYGSRRTGVTP